MVDLRLGHLHVRTSPHFAANEDYEEQNNEQFVFTSGSPAGSTTECIDISIMDDDKVEDTESFTFVLSSSDPVNISPINGVVFIMDDDSK